MVEIQRLDGTLCINPAHVAMILLPSPDQGSATIVMSTGDRFDVSTADATKVKGKIK